MLENAGVAALPSLGYDQPSEKEGIVSVSTSTLEPHGPRLSPGEERDLLRRLRLMGAALRTGRITKEEYVRRAQALLGPRELLS